MNRFFFHLSHLIIILFILLPSTSIGQISKRYSFSENEIKFTNLKHAENNYELITFKGANPSLTTGNPDLPIKYFTFYIPSGKEITDIKFKSFKQKEILLSNEIFPVQHIKSTSSNEIDTLFDKPNTEIYESDSFYPKNQVEIINNGNFDGNLKLVTVGVCPIQYNPKQLKVILSIDFEIDLITSNSSINIESTLFHNKLHDSISMSIIKTLVQNPQDVPKYDNIKSPYLSVKTLKSGQISWSIPFYEYVIITTDELKPYFIELMSWKRRKGSLNSVGIVTVDEILNDAAATGDPYSPSFNGDNLKAGKIRQYLMAGWEANITRYALFGGDFSIVPGMFGYGGDKLSFTWENLGAKIPSDLYYSDFNTNWTKVSTVKTGTYYYNSATDLFDYYPEIFVGRLLLNSENDIKNWIAKLLKYEQNPGNGDYSYLTTWLAVEADDYQAGNTAENISNYIVSGFNSAIIRETPSEDAINPTSPTGNSIISELNNHYGIFSNFTHGSAVGIAVSTGGINAGYGPPTYRYQITSLNSYTHDCCVTPENSNGLDNLTNVNHPFIFYTNGCESMPYDGEGIPDGFPCLARAFTSINLAGGPACIGNTRAAFDISKFIHRDFFIQLGTTKSIGQADELSKSLCADHWTKLAHNLVGCPEMPIWTIIPGTFSPTPLISENGTSVNVYPYYIPTTNLTKITVMSALDNGSSYYSSSYITPQMSYLIFTNVPKPYYVTITNYNKVPYIYNPLNVYIQNKTLNSTGYLNCQTVSAGNTVDASQTQGNVVIQSGANLVLDVTGDILLDKGFEVELGAYFEAK